MKSNVEKMPYLRNMNKAKEIAQSKLQSAHSNYQRLVGERNSLINKGREYIDRAENVENEALYEQGQAYLAKANQINSKMLRALQDYKDALKASETL